MRRSWVGNKDGFHWEDDKSDLLKHTRGISLIEVAEELFENDYVEYVHALYPEQTGVIGKVRQRLITLVYEIIDDDFSSFTRLITYWDASPVEKKIYMERTK
jgi:uncharacterized DUF497 family protein